MEIYKIHSSWKTTAEQILAEDIKDLSYGEKEVILQSFLGGAQTFMNAVLADLPDIKNLLDRLEYPISAEIKSALFDLMAVKIKNLQLHLNK